MADDRWLTPSFPDKPRSDAEGADWREVARIVLHIGPDGEPDRARQAFASHLARAKWQALAAGC